MSDGGAGASSRSDPAEPLDEREPLSGWPPRDFGITMSTLYRTLRQMEKDGYLESTWEPGPTGPARRVYSITAAGHEWLDSSAAVLDTYRQTIDRFLDLYGAGPRPNQPDAEPKTDKKGTRDKKTDKKGTVQKETLR